jgi:hypothetical protein
VRLSCAVSRKISSWCADITHTHRRAASPQCIFCLAVHCIIVHFPDLPHYLFTAPSRENFFAYSARVSIPLVGHAASCAANCAADSSAASCASTSEVRLRFSVQPASKPSRGMDTNSVCLPLSRRQ